MMEPKIRFNNNSWQKHKVGELCDLLTGYPFPGDKILNRGKNLLMRGINITEGRIRHSDEIDRYYNEDTIGLEKYRLQVGDLVIGMDGSKVGKNSALVTSKENYSLLVQRVARLRNEDKNLINLIQIAVGSDKFIKYVEEMKTSSAIPHISPADIRNFPLSLPEDSNERRLVASYFTSLDTQISASTSRLASLKQMKAASLQAMFPQEGETVPKIRFKGFEGEWKKVMFSETFEFLKNNSLSRAELSNEGDIVNVHYGDVLIKYGDLLNIQNEELTFIADNKIGNTLYNSCHLQNGDIIIADAAEDNTVGKCSEIVNICNKRVVSGLHTIPCRPLNRFAQGYLGHYINSESYHNQLLPLIQGSKISSISKKTLSQTIVLVPSIEEQKCIGNYFTSLDRQISLQSQRLEKLKQIKSACLDKMFV